MNNCNYIFQKADKKGIKCNARCRGEFCGRHKPKLVNRNEYYRNYYETNKESILNHVNEKILCECGCYSLRCHLARHKKSQKHIRLISQNV